MIFELRKTLSFEAAHRLSHLPENHKCGRLHGHSFKMTVVLRGPCLEPRGWVEDYADIKKAVEPLIHKLDHRYLNEIPGLENPTSEMIARYAYDFLKKEIPTLNQIIISETCTTECRYPIEKA